MTESIVWRQAAADHMWDGHKVTVAEAEEALADVDAAWFDPGPASESGHSVRVIGYCPGRQEILVIILYREDGVLWGATGWKANARDKVRREQTMSKLDERIAAAAAEAEATKDDPYPEGATATRPGHARSVVQSVRLPAEAFEEIERIAREAEVPVGALIRGWVLAGLAAERDTTLSGAVERLAADVDRVRRLASGRAA